MKALIMKDVYVIWKQMRMFILLILLMAMINNAFNAVFLVVWCSMLPYTAMAYDERSHWDQLAAMMPYRKRDIVLSKYVLGWLCMAAAGVLCFVMQTVIGLFSDRVTDVFTLFVSLCIGMISLNLTLPAVLRFGVERGRMIFMVIIFGAAIGAGILFDAVTDIPTLSFTAVIWLLLAAAAVLTVISIPLSMKLYETP